MKEIMPVGFEDIDVDFPGWYFSRYGSLPSSEEAQKRQKLLEEHGFNDQKRLQIIMRATVKHAIDQANRSMLNNSDIDPTEGFIPVY